MTSVHNNDRHERGATVSHGSIVPPVPLKGQWDTWDTCGTVGHLGHSGTLWDTWDSWDSQYQKQDVFHEYRATLT